MNSLSDKRGETHIKLLLKNVALVTPLSALSPSPSLKVVSIIHSARLGKRDDESVKSVWHDSLPSFTILVCRNNDIEWSLTESKKKCRFNNTICVAAVKTDSFCMPDSKLWKNGGSDRI